MADVVELAKRKSKLDPPPHVVYEAIADPMRHSHREWFNVLPGERGPEIIEAAEPVRVIWGSIWDDRPDLQVRFDIKPNGYGSEVTLTLLGPEGELTREDIERRRHRVSQLINGRLRDAFDS